MRGGNKKRLSPARDVDYVSMVTIGSGGAITGLRYILDDLPRAQGLQFEQQFWRRHKIDVVAALAGAPQGASMVL